MSPFEIIESVAALWRPPSLPAAPAGTDLSPPNLAGTMTDELKMINIKVEYNEKSE